MVLQLLLFFLFWLRLDECNYIVHNVSKRVIGGYSALKGEFPYQVAVLHATDGLICGGFVITKKWVLSAAHCFDRCYSKAMTTEDNGNIGLLNPTSSSNEDLSEYTDADESISAPTEFLAEFLSAVMLKDYETALKYCKLILQYEPNNVTAKEFYPLILEKLQSMKNDDDNSNDSEDDDNEENTSSSSNSSDSTSEDSSEDQEEEYVMETGQGDKRSKGSSEGDGTTGSYSSLEDDEAEVDQLTALAAKYQIDNMNLGNGNKFYGTGLKVALEPKLAGISTNAVENSLVPFGTSSDSESPTEPVSQQTIALLRAKVVPN